MKKKADKIMKFSLYLLWAFMFVEGSINLLTGNSNGIIMWSLDLAFLLFIYFRFKEVPLYFQIIFAILVIVTIFGEYLFGFYYIIPYYDKFLHFFDSIIYCGLVYYIAKPRIKNEKILLLFSMFAVTTYKVLWEIYEFSSDTLLGSTSQGVYYGLAKSGILFNSGVVEIMSPIADTMMDLIFNSIGILVFGICMLLYSEFIKKHRN